MAAIRHRPWLQHLESVRQQAAACRYVGIPERALLSIMMKSIWKTWYRARLAVTAFANDGRGVAAIEFAMIVPIMLVLFFGTVIFSSGVAVDRKVTLMARTFSDLVSQNISVSSAQLQNFFNADVAIMTPYDATVTSAVISELYIDPTTLIPKVEWSFAY